MSELISWQSLRGEAASPVELVEYRRWGLQHRLPRREWVNSLVSQVLLVGSVAAGALRDRIVTRAIEIGRSRMAAAKTGDGEILFTSETEQTAMEVAYALAEEFAPDQPVLPDPRRAPSR